MTVEERFLKFVEKKENGCWEWTGFIGTGGYGHFSYEGKAARAHRISYLLYKGPLIGNLEIDYKCKNKKCVNPDHLQQITHKENVLIGDAPHAINARKTHCKRGHELIGDNIRPSKNGERRCQACHRLEYERKIGKKPGQWVRDPNKTHCKNGHEYNVENTYYRENGRKQCKVCRRKQTNPIEKE